MKQQVDFIIPCENTKGEVVMSFNTVEEIDSVINTLEEARSDLEHQIEMERMRRREKKQRKKNRRNENQKEVVNIPVKLKNGNEFVVTCDDVYFNGESGMFNYTLNGEVVLSIPISSMSDVE